MRFAKKVNIVTILCAFSFLVGCTNAQPVGEGSVLVLTFSGVNADQLTGVASIDSPTPNFDLFVEESVRFTHAYTTSTLENAAMGSLLTGLYPYETGVRRNDAGFYKNDVVSLPEELSSRGVSTLFVSGGPPFLRKVATSRGFNDYDDFFIPGAPYYSPAKELSEKFLNQILSRADRNKFFAVLYFADPLFSGGLKDVDEALGVIKKKFQKWKQWDALTVVVVGMKGRGRSESLYDESIRVPLLIKPSRKPRDLAPSWKVDDATSLADVGRTLYSYFKVQPKKISSQTIKDLSKVLEDKNWSADRLQQDRVLISESDLFLWRGWGARQFAIRTSEWAYWPIEKGLFNTYLDRTQSNNLFGKDRDTARSFETIWKNINQTVNDNPGAGLPSRKNISILSLSKLVFSKVAKKEEKKRAYDDFFSIYRNEGQKDWTVFNWYLSFLYENKEIEKLKKEVTKFNPNSSEQKIEMIRWKKILQILPLGEKILDCEKPAIALKNKILEKNPQTIIKDCYDHETQAWLQAYLNFKMKKGRETSGLYDLARGLTDKRMAQEELAKLSWVNDLSWDYPPQWPNGLSTFEVFYESVADTDFVDFFKKKPSL